MALLRHETIATTHLLPAPLTGSAERYMLELCRLMAQRGHAISAMTSKDIPLLQGALRHLDVPVSVLDFHGPRSLLTPIQIAAMLRKVPATILTVHESKYAGMCCLGARLAGIPVLYVAHTPQQRWPFIAADHFVATSMAMQRQLLARGIRTERISMVRNGVDTECFTPRDSLTARRELGLNPAGFYFLSIGRVAGPGGMASLLDAFQTTASLAPTARLLIAGAGPAEDNLRARIDYLNLTPNVRFMGYSADMRRVLAAADCLVLPNNNDGTEQALLEAMAAGRPAIAMGDGNAVEMITDGDSGMLVTPHSHDDLCMALMFAARHSWWVRAAGAAARRRAVTEFAQERQYDVIEQIYYRLIDGWSAANAANGSRSRRRAPV